MGVPVPQGCVARETKTGSACDITAGPKSFSMITSPSGGTVETAVGFEGSLRNGGRSADVWKRSLTDFGPGTAVWQNLSEPGSESAAVFTGVGTQDERYSVLHFRNETPDPLAGFRQGIPADRILKWDALIGAMINSGALGPRP
jgi:hypothetical protein